MNAKEIILALHFEFKGNFIKIFNFIKSKQDAKPILDKWEDRVRKEIDNYAWYYDAEYPKELKNLANPPFIVKCK